MKEEKKGFFYIPTWALILICICAIGATIFDIYFVTNIDSFPTITVNGVEHEKGSEQYLVGVNTMKHTFGGTALVTLLIAFLTGYFAYKRKSKKDI